MKAALYAVVPLLDEAENAASLVASLSELGQTVERELRLEVLFVDDGSTDATVERLRASAGPLPHRILQHSANLGPGAAFATGFAALDGRVEPEDWVLTMEGDSTSSPGLIERLLAHRREGSDVILASPHLAGGGYSSVPFHRLLISRIANRLVGLRLGIRGVRTFTSFLRLYRGAAVIRLQERYGPRIVESSGFESMVELLGKIAATGLTLSEVAVHVDASTRRGKSKMPILKTIGGYGRLFVRWRSLSRARYSSASQPDRSLR